MKKAQAEIGLRFQRSKKSNRGRKYLTDEELAVAEATKILISNLNKGRRATAAEEQGTEKKP